MSKGGPFAASEELQSQLQEQITLMTTLFTLNKKCFKMCIGYDSQFPQNLSSIATPLLYGDKRSDEFAQAKETFRSCSSRCAYDYAKARNYVKDNFIKDMTITQERNDAIYDSFYNRNLTYE